jgi:peptide/nickel transport system substrate-binding protein
LARTLVSYNGRSAEEGGFELQPDLAARLPDVSADGLTWTFELKRGIRYGPPLDDIEITALDFVRAFERLLAPATESFGKTVFADIEGAPDYSDGEARSISGLHTRGDYILVFRLTQPTGDFGARLALSHAAPVPPDPDDPSARFGVAEGHDDGYGRFLVSSGPYMIEGSGDLDFTLPPPRQEPVSGLIPGHSVSLVRNPAWDAHTDPLRPAYPDRIKIIIVDTVRDALRAIDGGEADLVWSPSPTVPTIPGRAVGRYSGTASNQVHIDDYDVVRGIVINVAVPPFDDVHVRRALNYAVDKDRLLRLAGGSAAARVAGHLAPDAVEGNLLVNYDPYSTRSHRGDSESARAEMRRSDYDSDRDGLCDASVCERVRAVTRTTGEEVALSVRRDLRAIGIDLSVAVLPDDEYFASFDARKHVPLLMGVGWVKNHISASSYFDDQFSSAVACCSGSLVGASAQQLDRWGYEGARVPNIDKRIRSCLPLVGAPQFECWAEIDQYLMEHVVPWVPYAFERFAAVTSDRVRHYAYDQLTTSPALDQIAIET